MMHWDHRHDLDQSIKRKQWISVLLSSTLPSLVWWNGLPGNLILLVIGLKPGYVLILSLNSVSNLISKWSRLNPGPENLICAVARWQDSQRSVNHLLLRQKTKLCISHWSELKTNSAQSSFWIMFCNCNEPHRHPPVCQTLLRSIAQLRHQRMCKHDPQVHDKVTQTLCTNMLEIF